MTEERCYRLPASGGVRSEVMRREMPSSLMATASSREIDCVTGTITAQADVSEVARRASRSTPRSRRCRRMSNERCGDRSAGSSGAGRPKIPWGGKEK